MNKIGVCFIYYAIAIFGYQFFAWLADGTWTSYTVMWLWQTVLSQPRFDGSTLDAALNGVFHLPAAMAFFVAGVGIIAAVQGLQRLAGLYAAWGRRQWMVRQCKKVGYNEWSIPGVLASFDRNHTATKAGV